MGQVFHADKNCSFEWKNGAIGYRSGSMFDCLGPFAKVVNCPVEGEEKRYTCYATSYPDTFFSIPANTRIRGKYVKGYFTTDANGDVIFRRIKNVE